MNELRELRPRGAGWVRRESTNPLHAESVAESWWTHGAIVVGSSLVRELWGRKGVRTFARVTAELCDDGKTVYLGVAGHTITEGTGGRDAVVTEEQATSEDAWTALVGELKARRGRS